MNSLNNILVVLPNSRHATPALHRAMAYAHRSGAVLHLCLFDYYSPIDHSRSIFGVEVADRARRDFIDERMKWLSGEASGLARQGIRVECDVIWAPEVYKSIVAKAVEVNADLVIKDIDCESRLQVNLKPTSTDWKLMRLVPVPLMLVHPESKVLPRRFLAAVDVTMAGEQGQLNDRVLNAAGSFGTLSDATVDLVSVFSYMPLDAYASGFIADTYDIMNNAHRENLKVFSNKHNIDPVHAIRLCGFDEPELIARCSRERSADLVVLGSAYKSGFDRLTFGTVAESLIRKLQCDVLLVKPAGFEHELSKHIELPLVADEQRPVAA